MNNLVDIYIEGEKHKAMILHVFDLQERTFCIYAVPNGDGTFEIHCGKKIGQEIVDIEDEKEREVIENITKTLILEQKKEALFNMNDEDARFTVTGDDGVVRQAYIVGEFAIEGKNYFVYAVDEDENTSGLFIKRIIYNEKGEEESLETITNPEEKELVFTAMRNHINQEVGEM